MGYLLISNLPMAGGGGAAGGQGNNILHCLGHSQDFFKKNGQLYATQSPPFLIVIFFQANTYFY